MIKRKFGVLVISHGSRDPNWVKLVREACEQIELPQQLMGTPIECAFLELVEGFLIQDGIDGLEQSGVTDMIVIPLFISSGSTHIDEISWALGVQDEPTLPTDLQPFRISSNVHFCQPIDDDPEIAALIVDKLKLITEKPASELVLLVGHGSKEPGFYDKWRAGLYSLADQVKTIGGYAEADFAMLLPDELGAKVSDWHNKRPDLEVIVAPLFLSSGYFTNAVIPSRLTGHSYKYSGEALLPSPHISRWMERRLAEAISKTGGPLL